MTACCITSRCVIPTQAFGIVLGTFNETTAHSTSGKLTFGLIAAIWSASVGISALQDTLNAVYKIEESRSYIKARLEAIGLTILLMFIITGCLASMLGGDFLAAVARHRIHDAFLQMAAVITARFAGGRLPPLFSPWHSRSSIIGRRI